MTVHLVLYSSGPESSAKTISVHQTKLGAYKALRAFILERWQEYREHEIWRNQTFPEREYRFKFGDHEWWGLGQMELQP